MKRNVGGWDRTGRYALAAAGLVIGASPKVRRPWRGIALALGGLGLITAASGYCPMNQALGIDTARAAPKTPLVDVTEE